MHGWVARPVRLIGVQWLGQYGRTTQQEGYDGGIYRILCKQNIPLSTQVRVGQSEGRPYTRG